jgi:hypothetical protein
MKENDLWTVASLLSLLLFILHVADDVVRGFERGDLSNIGALPIFLVWLYGTLMLSRRRSGYIIVLLASFMGSGVPILHMMGKGIGVHGRIGGTDGALLFVSTLFALGAIAPFCFILSLRGLWSLRRSSQVVSQ